jgi:hypothetical protein
MMRLAPRQIDEMTSSEFAAYARGFALSRGVRPEPTREDIAEYFAAEAAFAAAGER